MKCDIEIFADNMWRKAATFELKNAGEISKGYKGAGGFAYDLDYALTHTGADAVHSVSCLYPVSFEYQRMSCWPSFLLDILPSGANRRYFLRELGMQNTPAADWSLLLTGGGNPPGNIRIAQAAPVIPDKPVHEGFRYEEIIGRAADFIEYAKENHAPVAGSSGAHGDAPKFLLTQDEHGRFHADGVLADHLARKHWLVKFPRGKEKSDRDILRSEGAYFFVARALGLHVGQEPVFDSDALFVPRFDRKSTGRSVIRFGLESLASLSDICDFGVSVPMERLCTAIADFSSAPEADIKEFVFRDIVNIAMGNTDNHARNTAMLKYPDGSVRLAPVYDFAPMFLDDQGIPRTCRWACAEKGGMPEWEKVAEFLKSLKIDGEKTREDFAAFAEKMQKLPDIMEMCKVDAWLIERLVPKIETVRLSLAETKPVIPNRH